MKNCCKYFTRFIFAGIMLLAFSTSSALAIEITAIDFNGDLIGKVIPDGKVVSYENQLIGNVTADSLILDFDGKLIGGVVPQGIAIGNDNKLLGKVNNDGSVRLASGKIIGKVLPNGLVVNDYFNVIGAVLFPGLVYSDEGKTVGRLTGDGAYTNLQGQSVGFVSPDGYAYRQNGNETILDGRLISSKMIISPSGKFIGSIVPGGQITDFEGKNIGYIHANGFAYGEDSKIIGRLVRSGYAFDKFGKYLGFVTYNGEVKDKDKTIGRLLVDGKIADINGKVIGFAVDLDATVTDRNGKYLGRIMPEGKLALARDSIGYIGAGGLAFNNDGKVIGTMVNSGPVFDYNGRINSHALKSGALVSLGGSSLGYISNSRAFDNGGKLIGKTMEHNLILSNKNTPLGVAGINGSLFDNGEKRLSTPFGYVYGLDGSISGRLLKSSNLYSLNGGTIAEISANGTILEGENPLKSILTQSGIALKEDNSILGGIINADSAVNFLGISLGNLVGGNLLLDAGNKILAKILPDYSVVSTTSDNSAELNPEVGQALQADIAIDYKGRLLGYVNLDGSIKNASGITSGYAAENGVVLDNNGFLVGGLVNYNNVLNFECQSLGNITGSAEVRNFREVSLGYSLLNQQVYSENGVIIGYISTPGAVVDYSGKVLGTLAANGHVLNYQGEDLGCINHRGLLYNAGGNLIGRRLEYKPVMNFNNNIIGRSVLNGQIVNNSNQFIGSVTPDDSAISESGVAVGQLFKYKYAFDNKNQFLGRVNRNAEVVDAKNQIIGQVDFSGYVIQNNLKIGYALYDMYVYDNAYQTLGLITKDGNVVSLIGQRLGGLDRGFLVDKNSNVLGRGLRDYYIRNETNQIIGELWLNNEVHNRQNQVVGTLGKDGNVFDSLGKFIAVAKPLQYYNVTIDREKVYDADGKVVGYLASEGNVFNEKGKLIGKLNNDGTVTDADGSIIGGVGADWYEKVDQELIKKKLPQVGIYGKDGELNKNYRKSLNIALTPDGEYLGDILEDGRVVDKEGKYLGRRMPDGLIIDDDGTLIGIEESQKNKGGDMFVPSGTFGPGGAYGTGDGAGGNLGPGGGFGPGERYDPQRAAALSEAQNLRRQSMGVGHVASNVSRESADGYQKNWDKEGITKSISSWRVNMSEMIFADKPIPAVIARSIDSNNPTPITAYVERNVYAEEGRNIIIPAGSRLMGTLNSMTATTETTSQSAKVQISWERLVRPDGVLFTFQGITADAMGRGGALGYLDQQLFKKYTLPVMTTALTSYTSYMMAPNDHSENEVETPKQQAANDARQNFLSQMNEVFSQILADKANIKPLTYVPAGTRIIVFPNVDLWMRTPERDEVSTGGKRNLLVDDKEVHAQINDEKAQKNNSVSTSGGGVDAASGKVLYESSNGDAQAVAPKLIDDASISNQQRAQQAARAKAAAGALPPPPPSTTSTPMLVGPPAATSNSGAKSGGGNTSSPRNDNSIPQLF